MYCVRCGNLVWSVRYSCSLLWYKLCGLKQFCAEVALCCRLSGSDTRQRMVLLFQSHEQDSRMEVQFFPFTKPVGMETWEDWLELQKRSINLMFSKRITVWINNLLMARSPVYFPLFQIWLHSFFSWNTVQFSCTGREANAFFPPCTTSLNNHLLPT